MEMILRKFFICLIFCHPTILAKFTTTVIGPKPLWNFTLGDQLKKDLLVDYDKYARPTQHYNRTTVGFHLALVHIHLNELKSSLETKSWVELQWTDEKLKWNSSDYEGMDRINLASRVVWKPDIFLYNSAVSKVVRFYGHIPVVVSSNGNVKYEPQGFFTTPCQINLKHWPYDTQECSLVFRSWMHNTDQIDLQLMQNKPNVATSMVVSNTEWKVTKHTMQRQEKIGTFDKQTYTEIEVNFTIVRDSPSYKAIIIAPTLAIIILTIVSFALPPQSGEKISIQACTVAINAMYLLYFTQKFPAMSTNTPLIVSFYTTSLCMVTSSLLASTVTIWMSRLNHPCGTPWLARVVLTNLCAGYNRFKETRSSEIGIHHWIDFELDDVGEHRYILSCKKRQVQEEWYLLAAAIDRLCIVFYSLVFAVMAISHIP